MKYTIITLILISILISSCDQINKPYEVDNVDLRKPGPKRVLLEEYTGAKCGNCPRGTKVAHYLSDFYGESVILLSIHAGYYAETDEAGGKYTYDFTSPEGTILNDFFDVKTYPAGMLNRRTIGGEEGEKLQGKDAWEPAIIEIIQETEPVEIALITSYDDSTREFTIDVDLYFFESGSSNLQLAVYLTESHIIQYQTDYDQEESDVKDYEHNHVLRGTVTGEWGEPISESDISPGEEITKHYTYKIDADKDWVPENMNIIAFVHDHEETHEILQVAEDKPVK